MKSINVFKSIAVALTLLCVLGAPNMAEAQFGRKLLKALQGTGSSSSSDKKPEKKKDNKPKVIPVYPGEFTDDKGISGKYHLLKPKTFNIDYDVKGTQSIVNIKYVKKEGDKFINEATVYYSPDDYEFIDGSKGAYDTYKWRKKRTKLLGGAHFLNYERYYCLLQLEPGVFAKAEKKAEYDDYGIGNAVVVNVFAKDKAKLEVYDLETAQAKLDQLFEKEVEAKALKDREKLMKVPVYKDNRGKVVFLGKFHTFSNHPEKPTEKTADFIKSIEMGEYLRMGAYLDKSIPLVCGGDCKLNIVYELNGKKVDYMKLRGRSEGLSKAMDELYFNHPSNFTYNGNHNLFLMRYDRMYDFAFAYLLYQQRSTFKEGKPFKFKATFYANRDGNNETKIAEGSMSIIYKKAFADKFFQIFETEVGDELDE